MSDQIESLYERELYYIRTLAAEFAQERPKIADRLNLEQQTGVSDDPHVERLIEAFAFLTARVRLKLDDEFPEITDALLNILYPHYLSPIPSMSVVQFHPNPEQSQLTEGHTIPSGSSLYSREIEGVPCRFQTSYPVSLWPLLLTEAQYQTVPFGSGVNLPAGLKDVEAMVRLNLKTNEGITFSDLKLDRLRFFLSGDEQTIHQVYELLFNHVSHVVLSPVDASPGQPPIVLSADCLKPVGFGREEGLLPYGNQSFMGYRLLTEYFTFPSKFMFVDVTGLEAVCRESFGDRLELFFLFDREDSGLETRVDADLFRLGCCPIVNLFKHLAEPIRLTQTKTEYHVIPDVRHVNSMEVYSVDSVASTDLNSGKTVEYRPFHSMQHGTDSEQSPAYWYAHRRASMRAGDSGSEVYLSLVDMSFDPKLLPDEVLTISTTCTNRNLPGEIRAAGGESWSFQLEGQAPLRKIVPVVSPTSPERLPFSENRWRLISHLALNHLSIVDHQTGAEALKEILKLYDYGRTRVSAQHISGILSVSSRRKTARLSDGLMSGFCRGIEVTMEFDPEKYTGTGLYLFASVLDRFVGLYTSMNSFTLIAKMCLA
ncbi:MAG: type VI secretion system baseplate subunit TssF, partial [Planctomycetes bacterium]|nr:type VI secretion system baseplate subunit TssF [Planctomycetota bacterium]